MNEASNQTASLQAANEASKQAGDGAPSQGETDSESALTELQLWMSQLLRKGKSLDKDPQIIAEAAARIGRNPRLLPVDQVEIYREQFWLRHTGSLLEDFPGLAGILGQQDWDRLVQGYLEAVVPTSFTLRDLGRELPEFAKTCDWLPHQQLCVDMARLEWAYMDLFDAPDAKPLQAHKLAQVPPEAWEHAHIVLSPAVRLLHVSYPVASLRRRLREAGDNESVPIPEAKEAHLALYRGENLGLFYREISRGAFALLTAASSGLPVVAAAEQAMAEVPDEPIFQSLGGWFREWGELRWIVDIIY